MSCSVIGWPTNYRICFLQASLFFRPSWTRCLVRFLADSLTIGISPFNFTFLQTLIDPMSRSLFVGPTKYRACFPQPPLFSSPARSHVFFGQHSDSLCLSLRVNHKTYRLIKQVNVHCFPALWRSLEARPSSFLKPTRDGLLRHQGIPHYGYILTCPGSCKY